VHASSSRMSSMAGRVLYGAAAAGTGGLIATTPFTSTWFSDLKANALAALATPNAQQVADVSGAHTAVLNSVLSSMAVTLNELARSQSRASSRGFIIFAAAAAGCTALLYRYGWNEIGWVSGRQLAAGLQAVQQTVGTAIAELRAEVVDRLIGVDQRLVDTDLRIQQVHEVVTVVQDDVRQVVSKMESIEERIASVASTTDRTATGVELLCKFVSTSGMIPGGDEQTIASLREIGNSSKPESSSDSNNLLRLQSSRAASAPNVFPSGILGMTDDQLGQAAPSFFRRNILPAAAAN